MRKYTRGWRAKHPKASKEYYEKTRNKQIASAQTWYAENMTGSFGKKLRMLLNKAKQRAKDKGIEFCIGPQDFKETDTCPLLGIKFNFMNSGKLADDSMSIDRIDPHKGYIPGNVWVISKRANQIKNSSTIEELEKILSGLKARGYVDGDSS